MRDSFIAGGLLIIFIIWAVNARASDPSGITVIIPVMFIIGTLIVWPFMVISDKRSKSTTYSPTIGLKASSYKYLKILIIGLVGTILFSVLLAFIMLSVSN